MSKKVYDSFENNFYKIMAENFGDEIFVTDGKGIVLFVNPAAVRVIGKPVYEIVGRNVEELEDEGFFKPSVTLEVLRQNKQVDLIQTLLSGKKVLCTGVPIYDSMQNIEMVVSTTKDVNILNEIFETIEIQKEEITSLREIAFDDEEFITGNEDVDNIKSKIIKIAPLDIPVLIQGETGVGKGVVAKVIHKFSSGKSKPMVKINCGTIPENLIESELFGYERGAFTGAEKGGKKGKLEMADGGTLFLDEIGELPISMQVKLLDFIQDGTFTRVGGVEKIKVSTRIITATNRDLKKMCEDGLFRKDLYYRINVVVLEIPPLRKREEDIDALTKYFISKCNHKYKDSKKLSEGGKSTLHEYSWPGNVRELEHIIEHAYIFSDQIITERDIKDVLFNDKNENKPKIKCEGLMPLKEAKHEVEKQLVIGAYQQYKNTYKVAEILKIDQSTVVKIMKKYQNA